jgi:hypothetical protein
LRRIAFPQEYMTITNTQIHFAHLPNAQINAVRNKTKIGTKK